MLFLRGRATSLFAVLLAGLLCSLVIVDRTIGSQQTLRLTSDKAGTNAIREGHTGTGMFPTTNLTNQELADTLSYLSVLRREGDQ